MAGRKSREFPPLLIFALIGVPIGLLFAFSIAWNPIWLFTKYRGIRRFLIAQYKHETGNGSSRSFKRYNNAFGMGVATRRKQVSIGWHDTADGVKASYFAPGQSLHDMILYLKDADAPTRFESAEDYVGWLQRRGYFTAPYLQYITGMKAFL
jgi:hypothetical protein